MMHQDVPLKPPLKRVLISQAEIDPLWFGEVTMFVRAGRSHDMLEEGDEVQLVKILPDFERETRIPVKVESIRRIAPEDLYYLSDKDVARTGYETAADLYTTFIGRLEDTGFEVDENTVLYLLAFDPPPVAAALRFLREQVKDRLSAILEDYFRPEDCRFYFTTYVDELGQFFEPVFEFAWEPQLSFLKDHYGEECREVLQSWLQAHNINNVEILSDEESLIFSIAEHPLDTSRKLRAPGTARSFKAPGPD